jgi:hypothetical protein
MGLLTPQTLDAEEGRPGRHECPRHMLSVIYPDKLFSCSTALGFIDYINGGDELACCTIDACALFFEYLLILTLAS